MMMSIQSFVTVVLLAGMLAVAEPVGAQNDVASLYRASYASEASRDYPAAISAMRTVESKGSTYFVRVRLGWLYYLSGDYVTSAQYYRSAAAAAPRSVEARLGLTLPLLASKSWRDLERACRDVLALDANNAAARARLAHALYMIGNYPDSATTYRALIEQYPAELDHQTGLGWALVKMGKGAEAKQIFRQVLAVSPDNANAKAGMALP